MRNDLHFFLFHRYRPKHSHHTVHLEPACIATSDENVATPLDLTSSMSLMARLLSPSLTATLVSPSLTCICWMDWAFVARPCRGCISRRHCTVATYGVS